MDIEEQIDAAVARARVISFELISCDDPARVAILEKQARHAEKFIRDLRNERDQVGDEAEANSADDAALALQQSLDDYIEDRNIIWLHNPRAYMARVDGELKLFKAESMAHSFPAPIPHKPFVMTMLSQTLQQAGRNYYDREYRIKGNRKDYFNLFQPDLAERQAGKHHFAFDLLMESLGNQVPENVSYLERWLLTRYRQIEAGIEDSTFPALVFLNKGGGSGKGLLTERVAPAMFGVSGVLPNASMNDIIGNFNDAILNKVVVHINEAAIEQTNASELKRLLGSPTLTVNAKFMPAFPIPNIMAVIISGNDRSSVVKLTGTKVDRRFSIIRTDCVWDTILGQYLNEIIPDETVSEDDIKVYTKDLADAVFSDRVEVGKWLRYLETKHGTDSLHIGEHHGLDYRSATMTQKPLVDRLVERIFDDEEFECIDFRSIALSYDCNFKAEGQGGNKRLRNRLVEDFEVAALQRGLESVAGYDQSRNKTHHFFHSGYDTNKYDENKFVVFEANGNKTTNIWVS